MLHFLDATTESIRGKFQSSLSLHNNQTIHVAKQIFCYHCIPVHVHTYVTFLQLSNADQMDNEELQIANVSSTCRISKLYNNLTGRTR